MMYLLGFGCSQEFSGTTFVLKKMERWNLRENFGVGAPSDPSVLNRLGAFSLKILDHVW